MFNELAVYPFWNLDLPRLPARSRLYHLLPLGLGTPFVESLTGYLARLAQAHCVSVGRLLVQEVLPIFDNLRQTKSFSRREFSSWFKEAYTLNGVDSRASHFVQTLEQLTGHNNLGDLTMLTWSNVIPTKRLLRRTRAWCPACYQAWRDTGQVIYEPLLFCLEVLTICPIHGQALVDRCPYPDCQQKLPVLSSRFHPGFCSSCKGWLGQASIANPQPINQDELAWQTWVGLAVGQLLAAMPSLPIRPQKDRIAVILTAHIEQLAAGNSTALARQLRLPKSTFRCWQLGLRLPHLTSLIQLSYCLGTSPLAYLTQDPFVVNSAPSTLLRDNPFMHKSRRNVAQLESHQLRAALEAALASAEQPPPSLAQLARRLGYEKTQMLRRRFPELCQAISDRHLDYHQKKAAADQVSAQASC